jgi:hypothetical protein
VHRKKPFVDGFLFSMNQQNLKNKLNYKTNLLYPENIFILIQEMKKSSKSCIVSVMISNSSHLRSDSKFYS